VYLVRSRAVPVYHPDWVSTSTNHGSVIADSLAPRPSARRLCLDPPLRPGLCLIPKRYMYQIVPPSLPQWTRCITTRPTVPHHSREAFEAGGHAAASTALTYRVRIGTARTAASDSDAEKQPHVNLREMKRRCPISLLLPPHQVRGGLFDPIALMETLGSIYAMECSAASGGCTNCAPDTQSASAPVPQRALCRVPSTSSMLTLHRHPSRRRRSLRRP